MRATERKEVLSNLFRIDETTPIDDQIKAILDEMQEIGVYSDDYPTMMTYLQQLNEIKAKGRRDRISRDTFAIVGGNLLGILLIVAYEQKHVMTSKGFSQLIRPKS